MPKKSAAKRVVEGKGDGPDHTGWIQKIKRSAIFGIAVASLAGAVEVLSPGMIGTLIGGSEGPWRMILSAMVMSALQTTVAVLTRSAKTDFQTA